MSKETRKTIILSHYRATEQNSRLWSTLGINCTEKDNFISSVEMVLIGT